MRILPLRHYFSDSNFTNLVKTQIDVQLYNFQWGKGSPSNIDRTPMNGMPSDNFSVRWTGQIQALEEGEYTISVNAGDTAKVWIVDLNGAPVINKTAAGGTGSNKAATFKMAAGQKYDIRIDYTDISGDANMVLYWTRPGLQWDIVRKTQLYPTTAPDPATAPANAVKAAIGAAAVQASPPQVNSAAVPTNRGTEEYHHALNDASRRQDFQRFPP